MNTESDNFLVQAQAALTATATLVSAVVRRRVGEAQLVATATLTSVATRTRYADSLVVIQTTLTAWAFQTKAGMSTLQGLGSVFTDAVILALIPAPLIRKYFTSALLREYTTGDQARKYEVSE